MEITKKVAVNGNATLALKGRLAHPPAASAASTQIYRLGLSAQDDPNALIANVCGIQVSSWVDIEIPLAKLSAHPGAWISGELTFEEEGREEEEKQEPESAPPPPPRPKLLSRLKNVFKRKRKEEEDDDDDDGGVGVVVPTMQFLFQFDPPSTGRRRLRAAEEDVWVAAQEGGEEGGGERSSLRRPADVKNLFAPSTVDWLIETFIREEGEEQQEEERRRRLDTFGESVVRVNQLYHKAFGVKTRKVPAHMPHMINKHVVSEMQGMWPAEWDQTSRNRFRKSSDMQYGFSYFYYLFYRRELQVGLNKGKNFKFSEEGMTGKILKSVWESEIDTDGDGILSENEFLSLGSLCYGKSPPKDYLRKLLVCLHRNSTDLYDVGFDEVELCKVAFEGMQKFALEVGNSNRHKEAVVTNLDEVAFQMIGDDYNDTKSQLDSVRSRRPKFICINDNMMNPSEAVIELFQDFLEQFFPARGPFELEEGTRNVYGRFEEFESVRWLVEVAWGVFFWGLVGAAAWRWAKKRKGEVEGGGEEGEGGGKRKKKKANSKLE